MTGRLVGRLPFSLYLALLYYAYRQYFGPSYSFDTVSIAALIITLLLFMVTSFLFGRRTSKRLSDGFFSQDFKPFVAKMRAIYEGNDSLAADLDKVQVWSDMLLAAISGVSISLFLSLAFLFGLAYLEPTFEVMGFTIVLLTLYTFYEIVKAPLREEGDEEEQQKAPMDLFEAYTVTNSVQKLPLRSKSLLFLAGKFFAPIAHIDVPKFTMAAPLVYENPELSREMLRLTNQNEPDLKVYLKDEDGLTLKSFFEGDYDVKAESITVMGSQSPKAVMPYILDSNYKYESYERRVWSGFSIVDTTQSRAIARGFVHKFRAVAAQTKATKGGEKLTPNYVNMKAIQFVLVGDRSFVQYFKIKVESLAVKVPSEVLNIKDFWKPER